jgi:hypothetical protein
MVMGSDRVRTVIPRTTPKDFTVRDPGISKVVDVSIYQVLTQQAVTPNARDQRRRAVGAPLALVASGVTTSAERCIA